MIYNFYPRALLQSTFKELKRENFGKNTENVDFGHEGVFWAKYDLGKSCRAWQNTLKNFFPIEKI